MNTEPVNLFHHTCKHVKMFNNLYRGALFCIMVSPLPGDVYLQINNKRWFPISYSLISGCRTHIIINDKVA